MKNAALLLIGVLIGLALSEKPEPRTSVWASPPVTTTGEASSDDAGDDFESHEKTDISDSTIVETQEPGREVIAESTVDSLPTGPDDKPTLTDAYSSIDDFIKAGNPNRLIVFTARSVDMPQSQKSWCPPCDAFQWQYSHFDHSDSFDADVQIVHFDTYRDLARQFGVERVPTVFWDGGRENHGVSAAFIASQLGVAVPDSVTYHSHEYLDSWVRARYTPQTRLTATVEPLSAVWQHLTDSNHGFKPEQVNGLEQWVALALHAAHHDGLIEPTGNIPATVNSHQPAASTKPTVVPQVRSRGSYTRKRGLFGRWK